jgi:hypothetical protein
MKFRQPRPLQANAVVANRILKRTPTLCLPLTRKRIFVMAITACGRLDLRRSFQAVMGVTKRRFAYI